MRIPGHIQPPLAALAGVPSNTHGFTIFAQVEGHFRSGDSRFHRTALTQLVHRLNLDDETVYAVRLQLAETGDFRLGVAENRAVKVCFTNRLDCPGWWNELSKWLGEYNVRKYQKFIELYGRPITDKDITENRYGILRVFRQVKTYFDENPEYGVLFPDVAWPV